MDNEVKEKASGSKETTSWTKETRYDGGGSERITVEKIKNGFLITTCNEYKDKDGCWQYETEKEFSEKNPLDESVPAMSLVDKLAAALKG